MRIFTYILLFMATLIVAVAIVVRVTELNSEGSPPRYRSDDATEISVPDLSQYADLTLAKERP